MLVYTRIFLTSRAADVVHRGSPIAHGGADLPTRRRRTNRAAVARYETTMTLPPSAIRFVPALFLAAALLVCRPVPTHAFPSDFLWGTAISGFQSEMGGMPANPDTGSDWWVWAHDPDNIADGRVSGDLPEQGPA